jgi:hypothetical protein
MQPIEMADSMPAKQQIRRDVMDDAHPQELRDALTCEQTATARYIADITAELARMAGQRQLDLLTYLLNMARVEAEMAARRRAFRACFRRRRRVGLGTRLSLRAARRD